MGIYRSAAEEGWRTRFISCLPSADQRSTRTRKKDQSISLGGVDKKKRDNARIEISYSTSTIDWS
jgi:hypothetical protein